MRSGPRALLIEILFTRWPLRLVIMGFAALSACAGLGAAFAQREFIDLILGHEPFIPTDWPPLAWLGISFLGVLLSLGCAQGANFVAASESFFMQRVLARRLYRHVLSLQSHQMRGRTVGEVVSIYTTDIPGCTIFLDQSMPQGFTILFPLILVPLVLVTYFGFPWSLVVGVLLAMLALNFFLALRQSRFFWLFKKLAADRIGLANEWIQNIRALRILGWTSQFERRIFEVRTIETKNRIQMLNNGQTMNAISSSVTYLLNFFFVGVLLWMSPEPLDSRSPGTLLALLWIVGVFMTRPFRQLPWFITFVFDGWTSLKRLHEYYALHPGALVVGAPRPMHQEKARDLALSARNLRLKIGPHVILDGIDLDLARGEFVVIVGEVGAGKTSLLLSLLGETSAHFDSYHVHGKSVEQMDDHKLRSQFAFVAQEGFAISGTLRENVALTYAISSDEDADIQKSLSAVHFSPREERLEEGLDTEIGERGVNLSGGQRQRVSLARAHYHAKSLLLFDDCFSALDVDTEQKLIQELFLNQWKDRTKLVATHRLSILKHADRVIYLEEGRIVGQGSLDDLLQTCPSFQEFFEREQAESRPTLEETL